MELEAKNSDTSEEEIGRLYWFNQLPLLFVFFMICGLPSLKIEDFCHFSLRKIKKKKKKKPRLD